MPNAVGGCPCRLGASPGKVLTVWQELKFYLLRKKDLFCSTKFTFILMDEQQSGKKKSEKAKG